MADLTFSKPELYLLSKWSEVHQLELAMQGVRKKYAEIFIEVLDRVSKKHKELTRRAYNCNENPEEDGPDDLGYSNVGIGKKSWPSKRPNTWPSGFWIGGVLLEDLKLEVGSPPFGEVWLYPPNDIAIDLDQAANTIEREARRLLGKVETKKTVKFDTGEMFVDYQLPQTRAQLLDLLIKDEARGFIDCMVGHFGNLAKLTQVVDEVFGLGRQTEKKRAGGTDGTG
jgi:hypothetical protein